MSREGRASPLPRELSASDPSNGYETAGVAAGGCEWPSRHEDDWDSIRIRDTGFAFPETPAELREMARFEHLRGLVLDAQDHASSDAEKAKYSKLIEFIDELASGE